MNNIQSPKVHNPIATVAAVGQIYFIQLNEIKEIKNITFKPLPYKGRGLLPCFCYRLDHIHFSLSVEGCQSTVYLSCP